MKRVMYLSIIYSLVSLLTSSNAVDLDGFGPSPAEESENDVDYGVDVSFPIHHGKLSTNYASLPHNLDPENNAVPRKYEGMPVQPLGNKQKFYDDFMQGCYDEYQKGKKGGICDATERGRVSMSLDQPKDMTNYTENGFKKIKTPDAVWKLISEFWEKNKGTHANENWGKGNTYVNHWTSPTHMVSVEDTGLRGGGGRLKNAIWNAAKDTLQEWTGEELTQCSLYGIRVYTEGAVLATHVDRLPLVSSAIVNVAQDTDEPWPIEVIGHDGRAYNVTMEPGDMVLYESHSVLHGRPFPMKGRFYANIFIHFEPTGHTLRHNAGLEGGGGDVHKKYREDVKAGRGGHENHESLDEDGLPGYIKKGSLEATMWHKKHPNNKRSAQRDSSTTGSTQAHQYAMDGNVEELTKVVNKLGNLVNAKDANGWTPLHEGARGGFEDVVKVLVEKGADINAVTKGEEGRSALYIAIEENGEDSAIVEFLESLGAISLGPDL
eukprot:CAMPEP_0198249708 /NCGR_PEP_ID=MMETSP1447-20131203/1137_1 /TAXON_ID=420782 /ORGANISM="Chaetoceros dichaeta, Strain CCMP1751" /LENGTH=490 /DNA_ID=CAMNT_0043934395 /DNA_START=116 /DNA_END=1588 /DNA_ORIENTATION=+